MKNDIVELIIFVVIMVGVLAASSADWVVTSHYEAKTYSRLTGKEVTTWDAMWLELRVQEEVQE